VMRAALGANPSTIHSISRPEAYRRWVRPYPTMFVPHIAGRSPVTLPTRAATARASLRRAGSGMAERNAVTLPLVRFVFSSAMEAPFPPGLSMPGRRRKPLPPPPWTGTPSPPGSP
jgi:hypothetical protein